MSPGFQAVKKDPFSEENEVFCLEAACGLAIVARRISSPCGLDLRAPVAEVLPTVQLRPMGSLHGEALSFPFRDLAAAIGLEQVHEVDDVLL